MPGRISVIVLLACAVSAFADDVGLGPVTGLKVDLEQVVELGTVSPVDGVTSAGQPDEAALRVFADAGYTTVIDLRGPDENRGFDEAAVVEALGMRYVHFPIEGPQAIDFDNARKLDGLLSLHDGSVLVHCASANRVGALLALRAGLEGADDQAALQHGRDAGLTKLEGVVRERLAEEP